MSPERVPGPIRQRGAIGLLAALVLLLVALCMALALDTGRLYMEKRNLQRIADLTALEVASRAESAIAALSDEELTALAESATNIPDADDLTGGDEFSVEAQGGGLCRTVVGTGEDLGVVRVFRALPRDAVGSCGGGAVPLRRTAVNIRASRTTRASLFGTLLGNESVSLEARATARPSPQEPIITFSLGSRLLEADGSGLLGELLGSGLNVTALGYEGLANATLSVADLIELAAGAGTANGLLQDVELDVASLARIDELNALARHPGVEQNVLSAGVSLFSDALDEFVGLGMDAVRLGEIISLDPSGGDDALQAEVGLLSLLETMAFVGNGRFLDLDSLALDLGILGGVDLALEVIEPPQLAIGRPGCNMADPPCNGQWLTQAHTGQVTLGARVQVGVPLVAGLDVLVGIRAVRARAGIDDVEAVGEGDDTYRLTTGAYHRPLGVDLSVGLALLSGATDLSDWLAERDFGDGGGSRMSPSPGLIEWPSEAEREFSAESTGDVTEALLGEAGSLNVVVMLAGLPVVIPADMLLGALEPVLTQLVASVLDPVLELLGLTVGAADMRIIEVEAGSGGAELVI